MTFHRPGTALFLLCSMPPAGAASAQSGGFIATLGTDTVQVEAFRRSGNRLEGTVVTRSPVTRIMTYTMTFDAAGRPVRYEVDTRAPDGTPLRTLGMSGSLTFSADSIVRETLQDGQPVIQRMAAPRGAYPSPGLPYLGVSYLMYQYALADARRQTAPDSQAFVSLLTMFPFQKSPQRLKAWFVAADSAELDYFGVARSGYKLDSSGQLIRADWTGTTYRYRIARVPAPDVQAVATGWEQQDRSGKAMGAMSPRDTARASLGAARLEIDYSRPSKRGRTIWGEVVPWNRVWRLGADFATHFTTTTDLTLGGVEVPAGTYTLWMLPREDGQATLIVNRQTRIFGTMYNPANDLVRIPLTRVAEPVPVDRLTLEIADGMLAIRWDNAGYRVSISPK